MNHILKLHDLLLQRRTIIRNDSSILLWMRRCWPEAVLRQPTEMTKREYGFFYRKLLRHMLSEWSEHLGAAILDKMWEHDACSFGDLNFDRFSCSIFFFAEMWVNEVTLEEYARIFKRIHHIMGSKDSASPMTRSTTPSAFLDALTSQIDMERDNASIGRSITFNAERFAYRSGGLPSLLQDPPTGQGSRTLNSALGTQRSTDLSVGAGQHQRKLASMELSDAAKHQFHALPSLSRVAITGQSTSTFIVVVVPKRLELLSCRNQGSFRLDA